MIKTAELSCEIIKHGERGSIKPAQLTYSPASPIAWILNTTTGQYELMQYNPTTGLYYPLAGTFWTDKYKTATTSEQVEVWPNDMLRIHYSFEYQGPEQTPTIEVGNCICTNFPIPGATKEFDKGSRNTGSKTVGPSLYSFQNVSGYVDVELKATDLPFGYTIFEYKEIYFLIEGEEREFVVFDALIPYSEAQFQNLDITSWAKVS